MAALYSYRTHNSTQKRRVVRNSLEAAPRGHVGKERRAARVEVRAAYSAHVQTLVSVALSICAVERNRRCKSCRIFSGRSPPMASYASCTRRMVLTYPRRSRASMASTFDAVGLPRLSLCPRQVGPSFLTASHCILGILCAPGAENFFDSVSILPLAARLAADDVKRRF